jgi:predicted esterase
MQQHRVTTGRTARYFTLGAPERADDVWFVCHGYGQLAARFLERFRGLEGEQRGFVAPEGLSRFYLSEQPGERRVGASWMTREDRLQEIEDYVRYLDAVYRAIRPRATTITALGFSQGTATVCRWAALGSARIDRVVLWGGEVPPDLDLTRLRVPRLVLVYGTRDEFFTPKVVAASEARLRAQGIAYERLSFDGGHTLDIDTLRRLS